MSRSTTTMNRYGWAFLALAGCLGIGCSSGEVTGAAWMELSDPAAPEPNATLNESAEAAALVGAIRDHFGAAILPPLPFPALAHRVEVVLPTRASGAFQVKDTRTGMAIDVGLVGAADATAEPADGFVVYRRAGPSGANILHRPGPGGTEDYLYFGGIPGEHALHYDVMLNEHVAGLRLVANTLEFLDAAGAPRLRMAAPWGVDSTGKRFDAIPAVEGCAYDTDPRGPWGRSIVAPGAARCTVHVRWDGADVRYPALVDPMWMSTKDMSTARVSHTASVLASGKVLIAGGATHGVAWLDSAELYDPASDTWAMTAAMSITRANHTQAILAGDKVLIAGGSSGGTVHASAEIYDAATGMWAPTIAPMSTPRFYHTASLFADGKVLVAGGAIAAGVVSDTSEIYDPGTGMWNVPAQMSTKRYLHAQLVLPDGKGLVLGGTDDIVNLKSAELYDPVANTWTRTSDMAVPHNNTTASLLPNGKVLVVAGYDVMNAELYDPVQRQFSDMAVADLSAVRYWHTASVLPSGKVLVVGGLIGSAFYAGGELYDPARNTWSPVESMSSPRAQYTASVLADGKVLVAGGNTTGPMSLNTAELFLLLPGDTCTASQDCGTGFCAGGICCKSECAASCQNGLLDTAVCDKNGDCQHPAQVSCFPYACDGTTACKSSCSSATDCAQGFECNTDSACVPASAECTDSHTLQQTGGMTIDCTPYRCEGHACLQTCASAADCIAPTVCDALSKQCIPPGTGNAAEAGGCALSAPASSGAPGWRWLAAIAIGGWLTRRRATLSAAA